LHIIAADKEKRGNKMRSIKTVKMDRVGNSCNFCTLNKDYTHVTYIAGDGYSTRICNKCAFEVLKQIMLRALRIKV